ncbi:hypothetical protein BpHYR1_001118 [Brachionus plicatilis]|uniref:Uncharacterized protein n=1 Tax=Brachionus plicatilis TaxID=10195 RepID=A0A3M7P0V8_BRAPC|nr:hypothetical protein BpHYR1_001118 [Brachionus plicatilis]
MCVLSKQRTWSQHHRFLNEQNKQHSHTERNSFSSLLTHPYLPNNYLKDLFFLLQKKKYLITPFQNNTINFTLYLFELEAIDPGPYCREKLNNDLAKSTMQFLCYLCRKICPTLVEDVINVETGVEVAKENKRGRSKKLKRALEKEKPKKRGRPPKSKKKFKILDFSFVLFGLCIVSYLGFNDSLDISINLIASFTSSLSTTLLSLNRAKAVERRKMPRRIRADVNVASELTLASFLISTYTLTMWSVNS